MASRQPSARRRTTLTNIAPGRRRFVQRAWIIPILALPFMAACERPQVSIEDSTGRYLDQVVTRVAEVATREGIPVIPSEALTAAHSEGAAVFLPSTHEDGRLVGWLDLPATNPCAAHLTPGYYVVEPRLMETEVLLTLREIGGSSGLEGLRSDVEREVNDDDLHPPTLVRIALGPEHFSSWGWHKCSDGIGCCRWALTLDASTPGCS
jgi:hypothetical protein